MRSILTLAACLLAADALAAPMSLTTGQWDLEVGSESQSFAIDTHHLPQPFDLASGADLSHGSAHLLPGGQGFSGFARLDSLSGGASSGYLEFVVAGWTDYELGGSFSVSAGTTLIDGHVLLDGLGFTLDPADLAAIPPGRHAAFGWSDSWKLAPGLHRLEWHLGHEGGPPASAFWSLAIAVPEPAAWLVGLAGVLIAAGRRLLV